MIPPNRNQSIDMYSNSTDKFSYEGNIAMQNDSFY